MEQLKNVEENIYSSAVAFRKELEECTYNTSWLPSYDELDIDCFPVSHLFGNFSLFICNDAAPDNDKTEKIISSLSQDLFYAVHQGKKLTPKNILLPLLIKSLTNNTNLLPQSQDWDMVCLIQNWEKLSLKWRTQELTITSME